MNSTRQKGKECRNYRWHTNMKKNFVPFSQFEHAGSLKFDLVILTCVCFPIFSSLWVSAFFFVRFATVFCVNRKWRYIPVSDLLASCIRVCTFFILYFVSATLQREQENQFSNKFTCWNSFLKPNRIQRQTLNNNKQHTHCLKSINEWNMLCASNTKHFVWWFFFFDFFFCHKTKATKSCWLLPIAQYVCKTKLQPKYERDRDIASLGFSFLVRFRNSHTKAAKKFSYTKYRSHFLTIPLWPPVRLQNCIIITSDISTAASDVLVFFWLDSSSGIYSRDFIS